MSSVDHTAAADARLRGRLDLLLTDVVMPAFDGHELAHRLVVEQPNSRYC
jgi:CheY-like chemotaxis protein